MAWLWQGPRHWRSSKQGPKQSRTAGHGDRGSSTMRMKAARTKARKGAHEREGHAAPFYSRGKGSRKDAGLTLHWWPLCCTLKFVGKNGRVNSITGDLKIRARNGWVGNGKGRSRRHLPAYNARSWTVNAGWMHGVGRCVARHKLQCTSRQVEPAS